MGLLETVPLLLNVLFVAFELVAKHFSEFLIDSMCLLSSWLSMTYDRCFEATGETE